MNKRAAAFLILCLTTIFGLYYIQRLWPLWLIESSRLSTTPKHSKPQHTKLETPPGYLVYSSVCKIPSIDPFDASVKKYFYKSNWKPCPGGPSLTYQNNNELRINKHVLSQKYKNFSSCNIYRIERKHDDKHIKYILKDSLVKSNRNISHEFIKVQCYDKGNKTIYTNLHAFIQKKILRIKDKERNITQQKPNRTLKNSIKYLGGKNKKFSMNVLLIGIDSVSRLNFIRQMPLTRDFLTKHGAIEMFGYNKVGSNTYPNMVPLLTGHHPEELAKPKDLKSKPFDKYDIIWKDYKKLGYVTMYSEDEAPLSTFNYYKYGFKKQPTDHYFRPFDLALHQHRSLWPTNKCFKNRMEVNLVLQYTYDYIRLYKNDPYFALSYLTSVSHGNVNHAGKADDEYLRFLQRSFNNSLLNDTILFMFGDHGIMFGEFRKTYIGRMENRLPAMYILPPAWFQKKYPTLWNNLKLNAHRLTSHFDIYETLKDILDIEKAVERSKSDTLDYRNLKRISLFRKVPLNRSCEAASIKKHLCTCHVLTSVDVKDQIVIKAANYLVSHINNMTLKFQKICAKLRLRNITNAAISVIDGGLQTHKDYQITIQTLPGQALFEGSARYFVGNKRFTLLGMISRINLYGHQSNCVKDYILKNYCYCSKL